MRLWTLHPKYLDQKGLVALWREALLAQAVLRGETKGYLHHPQLIRFRQSPSPCGAIASYLRVVQAVATQRGYSFDITRISSSDEGEKISATEGQLLFEWNHLKQKLQVRAPEWLAALGTVSAPEAHPLFSIVPGRVEEWEKAFNGGGRDATSSSDRVE